MTPAAHARAMQGLNAMARKVLDVVPKAAEWSKAQIVAELRRTGSTAQTDVIEGCLNTLRGHGLVTEPNRGQFRRVQPRQTTAAPTIEQPENTPMAQSQGTALDAVNTEPLARLAAVAKEARALATRLIQIADEIEDTALQEEERVEAMGKDTETLRQLQGLLKGIAK